MALSDDLNGKTVQELINDDTFITALVPKIAAGAGTLGVYTKEAAGTTFAKIDGSNATDPGVNTMLGKLIDANKVLKVDGSNATDPGVNTMLGKLIDANKVLKVDGSNATDPGVTAMLGKLTGDNRVVKFDGTNADNILTRLAVPTADAVANVLRGNTVFVNAIKAANAQDVGFQKAVKDVMLQSNFEIPTDPSAPISWDW